MNLNPQSSILNPAQVPLPLEDQSSAALLRAVFERSGLRARGWTFDRALRTPAVRICLERTAQAVARARARKARRAAHGPQSSILDPQS